MITLSATENQLREAAASAIARLSGSERGRRVLSTLANASTDIAGLDSVNSEALRDVITIFSGHRVNGTMIELLRPYDAPKPMFPPSFQAALRKTKRFADYDKRACRDYILHHDANGFATLEGDETVEQLREACVTLSEAVVWPGARQ
jgi:hypothetical protein